MPSSRRTLFLRFVGITAERRACRLAAPIVHSHMPAPHRIRGRSAQPHGRDSFLLKKHRECTVPPSTSCIEPKQRLWSGMPIPGGYRWNVCAARSGMMASSGLRRSFCSTFLGFSKQPGSGGVPTSGETNGRARVDGCGGPWAHARRLSGAGPRLLSATDPPLLINKLRSPTAPIRLCRPMLGR